MGVSVVSIVPLNGSDVGGEVYAQVHPNGDVRLTGTPTGLEEVLFWHVVPGSCERWSVATYRGTPTDELLPTFYSQSIDTGVPVPIDEVIPEAKSHEPFAIVAYAAGGTSPLACAAIPAVPPSFKVTLPPVDSSAYASCPVTLPPSTFVAPTAVPGAAGSPTYFSYGTNDLSTNLPVTGNWAGLPSKPGEGYGQKIFWRSNLYDLSSEPFPALAVTGKRLDAQAPPMDVGRPTNGAGAMLVGVSFPTLGCWQITGTYKGNTLSFVIWVSNHPLPATATPTSTLVQTPLDCTPESDKTFLQQVIAAFNRGDQAALATFFPDDSVPNNASVDRFWFSQQGNAGLSADNRSDLLADFAQRHAQHEKWQMTSGNFGGGGGNFSMTIESDSTPLRTLSGKISIDCTHGWINSWYMSDSIAISTQVPSAPITLPDMPIVLPSNVPESETPSQFGAADLGGSCDPSTATRPITGLIAAFNRGDRQSLATFLPAPSSRALFQIKSSDQSVWSSGGSAALLTDLASRHDAGEQWDWDRIEVDSQTHGGLFRFRLSIERPGKASETAVGQGLLNCDSELILMWNMLVQMPTPLDQANSIWSSVSAGVGATIDPILRPSQVPDGFDGVDLLNASAGTFAVDYLGTNEDVRFGVGGFNPLSIPMGAQQRVTVRGQQANLSVGDSTNSGHQVWLWWHEPGTWVEGGQTQPDGVLYYVSAQGLIPDEVLQFANSLTPLTLP